MSARRAMEPHHLQIGSDQRGFRGQAPQCCALTGHGGVPQRRTRRRPGGCQAQEDVRELRGQAQFGFEGKDSRGEGLVRSLQEVEDRETDDLVGTRSNTCNDPIPHLVRLRVGPGRALGDIQDVSFLIEEILEGVFHRGVPVRENPEAFRTVPGSSPAHVPLLQNISNTCTLYVNYGIVLLA